jgi:pimeloyl-ACP methyl ester carboxylesterase
VFLHGLGGTGPGAFGLVLGDPQLGGRRTLVIDLPGHGSSDRPDDWDYSLESFAEVVARVLEAAGLEAVDLVGHSMGGSIGIVLAARYPELVGRLVVAEGNLDPLPPSPVGLGSQRISYQAEDAFVASGFEALLAANPEWASTMRQCDPRAVHRSAVGIVTGTRPTMRELFVGMTIPRTFIRGELGEPLVDPEGLEAAGVRIVVIPAAGHVMTVDNPGAFVAAVVEAFPTA